MIESYLVDWIVSAATSVGSRVHVGARLLGGALPACVVGVESSEFITLKATSSSLKRYQVSISSIAETMVTAQAVDAELVAAIKSAGTVNVPKAIVIQSSGLGVLEDPSAMLGDEQNLAVCTSRFEIITEL